MDALGSSLWTVAVPIMASIAAIIIWEAAGWIVNRIRENRFGYTGVWEDEIFDSDSTVVKRDSVELRQRGEEVYGNIRRIIPVEQNDKRWKFYGRIIGSNFFAVFWQVDRNDPSYGCWYLHRLHHDDAAPGERELSGYYLKFSDATGEVVGVPVKLKQKIKVANAKSWW